jgi:adenine/guanine phosphoribosyltransferase-like PRPP-binding protein
MNDLALNMMVKELITEHTGGRNFFNALDAAVKNESFFEKLYCLITQETNGYIPYSSIASGKFGLAFSNWLRKMLLGPPLLVSGELRHGENTLNLSIYQDEIEDKDFIFIDDSLFSGTTRNLIRDELEKYGGRLVHTYVVYDGAPTKDPEVTSLYRYYDEYVR